MGLDASPYRDILNEMSNIGEKIKSVRLALGMTQDELAEAVSVEPASVSKWERGKTNPSARNIPRLAKTLQKSAEWLTGAEAPSAPAGTQKQAWDRISQLERKVSSLSGDMDGTNLTDQEREILTILRAAPDLEAREQIIYLAKLGLKASAADALRKSGRSLGSKVQR